ncbi:MAG: methyltransferase domain-containing protein [Luteolibacter sp.]
MPDPYSNPDAQPESSIQAMATRLEERGRHAAFLKMIRDYASSLPDDRPLTVLDLGCGTGVVIRQLAGHLHPSSVLHGADISAELLKEAARLAPSGIHWDHLASGPLPYRDATFDAVTMHTLLSHVPDPAFLLAEARRILKPDGRLIVFDADHSGTTYNQPTYEITRRIDHLLTSTIATHPDICRQLPRFLKSTGFELIHHQSEIISECGKGDYWLSSVHSFSRLLPTLGVLTPQEADSWVEHMLRSHQDGTFFAAGAFYTFHARPEN